MDSSVPRWSCVHPTVEIFARPVEVGILRIFRDDADAPPELTRQFGFEWPVVANTIAGRGVRAAWVAPGTWAVFGPKKDIATKVATACVGHLAHFGDMSGAYTLWRIRGTGSRSLMARACSIDTHPRCFPRRYCVRSLFANVPALLMRIDDADGFELLADASYGGYLQVWFLNDLQHDGP